MISSKAKKLNDKRNDYWSLAKKTKYTNGTNVIVLPVTYNYSNTLGGELRYIDTDTNPNQLIPTY